MPFTVVQATHTAASRLNSFMYASLVHTYHWAGRTGTFGLLRISSLTLRWIEWGTMYSPCLQPPTTHFLH